MILKLLNIYKVKWLKKTMLLKLSKCIKKEFILLRRVTLPLELSL